ncbi:hypothetical protein [Streptomyces acidiscabies]|uniref:Uncharacterized protein n=1 Tax=Streptomyces acidiscabies TaxID=42234 RepID=A0AAP6EEU3_9ACTN|nr:hypothetical protein [Streptomyces acidiscabies]MBP5936348.1 hypothetical protein [Streptomyces sp. LBUM 1476]MBZ3915690.1 hypothetical protein [Streptomyces acidiscabies]MDX2960094.1 hypothetical protein [Streptomyces acidiscabies]MDX3019445.1 hypothetical protein [Streptomyces acidiscabies]MDX3793156.1 hypothetical protein [Streptomyces acidiscabies]
MRERPDLSVPQVAGGALAAVLAAKLASSFGVYGTILGAGVVSVIATCGGSLFQHFFKRTGEQLREATTTTGSPEQAPARGAYSAGTVHRARGRGLRRPVLAAVLVFGVTMTGITAYELASGSAFSGGGGTTVSDAVSGRGAPSGNATDPDSGDSSRNPGSTPSPGSPAPSGDTQAPSPSPSGEPSGAPQNTTPSATGSPTEGAGEATPAPSPSATAPTPSADSRSGTADPGPAGPAAR